MTIDLEKQECLECGLPTFLDDYGLCNACYLKMEEDCAEIEKQGLDKLITMPYSVK